MWIPNHPDRFTPGIDGHWTYQPTYYPSLDYPSHDPECLDSACGCLRSASKSCSCSDKTAACCLSLFSVGGVMTGILMIGGFALNPPAVGIGFLGIALTTVYGIGVCVFCKRQQEAGKKADRRIEAVKGQAGSQTVDRVRVNADGVHMSAEALAALMRVTGEHRQKAGAGVTTDTPEVRSDDGVNERSNLIVKN